MRGASAPRIVASKPSSSSLLTPYAASTALRHGVATLPLVQRPARFEAFRYIGDKRNQIVYDTDRDDDHTRAAVDDLMQSERFTAFSPDTLGEARNRGYRPDRRAKTEDADSGS